MLRFKGKQRSGVTGYRDGQRSVSPDRIEMRPGWVGVNSPRANPTGDYKRSSLKGLEVINEGQESHISIESPSNPNQHSSIHVGSNPNIETSKKKHRIKSAVHGLRSGLLNLYSKAKSSTFRPEGAQSKDGKNSPSESEMNRRVSGGSNQIPTNFPLTDSRLPSSKKTSDEAQLMRTRGRPSIFSAQDMTALRKTIPNKKPKLEDLKLDVNTVCVRLEEYFKIEDWKTLKKYYTGNPEFSDCT
jgi:hypothetical protein